MILDESKLDREGFENAYVDLQRELYPSMPVFTVADCAGLRGQHGDYREFAFMYGCWRGWCLAMEKMILQQDHFTE